jgi:hypothetical protein
MNNTFPVSSEILSRRTISFPKQLILCRSLKIFLYWGMFFVIIFSVHAVMSCLEKHMGQ